MHCRELIREKTCIDFMFCKRYVSESKKLKLVDTEYYAKLARYYRIDTQQVLKAIHVKAP